MITWKEFTEELKTDVQQAFQDSYPDGVKSASLLSLTSVQKTQTIEIYGSLPGEPQQLVAPGPRLGIRASNYAGGVRVTQVAPNSAGDHAGFESGDIILEINGMPILNAQDFSKAVDESPKTMKVKVIGAGDGHIFNTTLELGH